jgi:hypothetical protein
MHHARLANRPDRRQRARRGTDEIADATDIDHRMVDIGRAEDALEVRDHRRRPAPMLSNFRHDRVSWGIRMPRDC